VHGCILWGGHEEIGEVQVLDQGMCSLWVLLVGVLQGDCSGNFGPNQNDIRCCIAFCVGVS